MNIVETTIIVTAALFLLGLAIAHFKNDNDTEI